MVDYNTEQVANLESTLKQQMKKINNLRKEVRNLKFVPIEPAGYYSSITYKSFDGGSLKLRFDPLEMDWIEVADSNRHTKLRFVIPVGDGLEKNDFKGVEEIPLIKNFLHMLGASKLSEASEIYKTSNDLMEIAEFACIFDKIVNSSPDDKTIVMKDGYLRTKKIKAERLVKLKDLLKKQKSFVMLVGVAKTSKIVSMLSTALFLEKKIPANQMGYIKVPVELELKAYKWSGSGKIGKQTKGLNYTFGGLYIAKLSKLGNVLVTIEIPEVYSEQEASEIISYLATDSKYSYPVLGYPQTIMRAHEAAVRIGFPASIIKDRIMQQVKKIGDDYFNSYLRDGWLYRDFVDKGVLGGVK